MNLGSPASTDVQDVRAYLQEFLMDKYVIDYPYIFRYLLVNGIISKFRAPKSAKAYKKIWRRDGSPLVVLTQQLCDSVRQQADLPVYAMMRYGRPSPKEIFGKIKQDHPDVEEVLILPLYPHWTMSSYETAITYSKEVHKKDGHSYTLKFIDPFYDKPDYIEALAGSIRPYLETQPNALLIFSYHGIPVRHIRKDEARRDSSKALTDFQYPKLNYKEQCFKTSQLTADRLGLEPHQFMTSFQSRLRAAGKRWLQPSTAEILEDLPGKGHQNILVVCPAFINDCLETLEEIAMEGKESFLENGGKIFQYIPCINHSPEWVSAIVKWAKTS